MKEVREFRFHVKTPPSEELIKEFIKGVLEAGVVAKYGIETMKEVLIQIEERDREKVVNKQ